MAAPAGVSSTLAIPATASRSGIWRSAPFASPRSSRCCVTRRVPPRSSTSPPVSTTASITRTSRCAYPTSRRRGAIWAGDRRPTWTPPSARRSISTSGRRASARASRHLPRSRRVSFASMQVGPRRGWPAGARALLPWLLLVLGWCVSIQVRPLFDPDEGRYAEIPREMLASGDWVTPRYDGLKYFEKPPLQYWGTAATYAVFGVSEWTSRLWSFTLAFACLPLVYAWTRRLFGSDGALAALAAIGMSPLFIVIGHINLLDGAFTFWLTG